MKFLPVALLASACILGSSVVLAQPSADTVGSKASNGANTVGGTAGSAAAGGTSASTLGLGAGSTGPAGSSSAVGGAGSAAAVDGKATSNTKIRENPQMLRAQSRAKAQDGGTWSKSMTNTAVRKDTNVGSSTRSMSHEPGGKPAMSKSRVK